MKILYLELGDVASNILLNRFFFYHVIKTSKKKKMEYHICQAHQIK